MRRRSAAATARSFARVICHSEWGRRALVERCGVRPGRVRVIPHGAFRYLRDEPEVSAPVEASGPLAAPAGHPAAVQGRRRPRPGLAGGARPRPGRVARHRRTGDDGRRRPREPRLRGRDREPLPARRRAGGAPAPGRRSSCSLTAGSTARAFSSPRWRSGAPSCSRTSGASGSSTTSTASASSSLPGDCDGARRGDRGSARGRCRARSARGGERARGVGTVLVGGRSRTGTRPSTGSSSGDAAAVLHRRLRPLRDDDAAPHPGRKPRRRDPDRVDDPGRLRGARRRRACDRRGVRQARRRRLAPSEGARVGPSRLAAARGTGRAGPAAYRAALEAPFLAYAELHGKPRWADKTPYYVGELDQVKRVFPEARIVNLVRDGRDVALSLLRVPVRARERLGRRSPVAGGRRRGRHRLGPLRRATSSRSATRTWSPTPSRSSGGCAGSARSATGRRCSRSRTRRRAGSQPGRRGGSPSSTRGSGRARWASGARG